MTNLKDQDLDALIHLCRIACTEEEKKELHNHLSSLLAHFLQLEEIDTEGVEPCFVVSDHLKNVMRDDIVGETLSRELFLANAPSHIGGMIRVPTVLKSQHS